MPKPFEVDSTSYPATTNDFEPYPSTKTKICLHHTAGNSTDGAITTLRQPDYVMVHFCVGKDGAIYQFFPMKYWAFHLGVRELAKGALDRVSIGIEIVNVGPLVLKGDELNWWPRDYNATYCKVGDTDQYYQHDPWRGFTYSSTYTSAQYDSVGKLVAWLCASQGISPSIWNVNGEYALDGLTDFNGVFTHVNCRRDKTDLSVGWSWDFFNTLLTTAYAAYNGHTQEYDDPLI